MLYISTAYLHAAWTDRIGFSDSFLSPTLHESTGPHHMLSMRFCYLTKLIEEHRLIDIQLRVAVGIISFCACSQTLLGVCARLWP